MSRRVALGVVLAVVAASLGLAALPEVRQGLAHVLALLRQGDLDGIRAYLRSFGLWAPVVSVGLMQLQALIAPLPSFPIMYANGLLFGTVWGGLLSFAGILLSAVLCFGLARLFGRPLVERVVSPTALAWADRQVVQVGAFAVFLARLVPLTSFDLVSYAAGLTPMRLGRFSVATALGMAPAIFLTAAAGDAGWHSPWALAGGLLGFCLLAGVAALLRPVVARRLGVATAEPTPPARSSAS